jgi:hypothetical protein
MTKYRFKACTTTKTLGNLVVVHHNTGQWHAPHKLRFMQVVPCICPGFNSAARFIAESINVPVDLITTILNEAPPDDREAVIRMAEALRRSREKSQ